MAVGYLIFSVLFSYVYANPQQWNIIYEFNPPIIENLEWLTTATVHLNITCNITSTNSVYTLEMHSSDPSVADVKRAGRLPVLNCSDGTPLQIPIVVKGHRLGRTNIDVSATQLLLEAAQLISGYGEHNSTIEEHLNTVENGPYSVNEPLQVIVQNRRTALNDVFLVVVACGLIILSFGFGNRIEISVVKEILRRPVAPTLGMCCQFIVMPLLGLALSQALLMDKMLGFGLFVTACAPSGGGSNIWTVLLNGDLDLSMTMTLFSKTLALGTMPLWLFVAGPLYGDVSIKIPYRNIIIGLASVALPCLGGVLLRWKFPRLAARLAAEVKPVAAAFIMWLIVVGSAANYYVYYIMLQYWCVTVGAILLPYLGVLLGYLIAHFARQPHARSITIGIETGVQDTGVAILLLLTSFGRPEGAVAAAVPIAVAIATPLPFAAGAIYLAIRDRCWRQGRCVRCGGPNKPDPEEDEKMVRDKSANLSSRSAEINSEEGQCLRNAF